MTFLVCLWSPLVIISIFCAQLLYLSTSVAGPMIVLCSTIFCILEETPWLSLGISWYVMMFNILFCSFLILLVVLRFMPIDILLILNHILINHVPLASHPLNHRNLCLLALKLVQELVFNRIPWHIYPQYSILCYCLFHLLWQILLLILLHLHIQKLLENKLWLPTLLCFALLDSPMSMFLLFANLLHYCALPFFMDKMVHLFRHRSPFPQHLQYQEIFIHRLYRSLRWLRLILHGITSRTLIVLLLMHQFLINMFYKIMHLLHLLPSILVLLGLITI